MDTVIFSDHQGSGYICYDYDDITNYAHILPIQVNGKTYQPGDKTTLDGFFCRPLEYVGRKDSEAIFFMGKTEDIFNKVYYYQSVYIISNTRLFLIYGPNFGRDWNLVNGHWK